MNQFRTASGARFDRSGRYRYTLWRVWDRQRERVAFIMLNPSTADAEADDPTIRRCTGFARQWGFGGLLVGNLFAYRTSQPCELRRAPDPVGSGNDRALSEIAAAAALVVLAWGNAAARVAPQRAARVLQSFGSGARLHCLGLTRQGMPRHPLYVRAGAVLLGFAPARGSRPDALCASAASR